MRGAKQHLKLVGSQDEPTKVGTMSQVLSFDDVFRTYAPYVAAIGLRLLGRYEEVDDLVQDVFFEAHKNFDSIRDPQNIKWWISRIAVRVAHRRLEKRKRWKFLSFGNEFDYSQLPDFTASPEACALIARVYSALDSLPANQRIAWTLRHVQGERLDQVALMCECSLATAKRRIAAAHHAIREALDE